MQGGASPGSQIPITPSAVAGAILAGLGGGTVLGPVGAIIGVILGGVIGQAYGVRNRPR